MVGFTLLHLPFSIAISSLSHILISIELIQCVINILTQLLMTAQCRVKTDMGGPEAPKYTNNDLPLSILTYSYLFLSFLLTMQQTRNEIFLFLMETSSTLFRSVESGAEPIVKYVCSLK
jgi:hypothetical protein